MVKSQKEKLVYLSLGLQCILPTMNFPVDVLLPSILLKKDSIDLDVGQNPVPPVNLKVDGHPKNTT